MRSIVMILLFVCMACFAACVPASAYAPPYLSENWDGYTSGSTPYTNNGVDWELSGGSWMSLTGGQARSAPQSYAISDYGTSQIRYAVDFAGAFQGNTALDHIAVQGWFYDSGGMGISYLGLGNHETVNNAFVRIGANGGPNYVVQYGEFLGDNPGVKTVDTGLATSVGWHFARLDIVNLNYIGLWRCTWRVGNPANPSQATNEFGWFFDRAGATRVVLGAETMTYSGVSWDDIKVGSYEYVGPVPVPEPATLMVLSMGLVGLVAGARLKRRSGPS